MDYGTPENGVETSGQNGVGGLGMTCYMINRIAAARSTKPKSPDHQWHQVCLPHIDITAAPNVTQIEPHRISVNQFILLRLVLKMKPNLNPNIIW